MSKLHSGKPDLGTMVLAIVKAREAKGGAFTDEITQSILALRDKIELEPVLVKPGPTGPDSDRVRSIVGVYRVRGFLKEDSPAKITEKGKAKLDKDLRAVFSNEGELRGFWSLLS